MVEINLVPNPFHVFQEYLLPALIVKVRGTAVGMSSDPLSDLKISVILDKAHEHSEASGFAFDGAGVFRCSFTDGTEWVEVDTLESHRLGNQSFWIDPTQIC